MKIRKKVLKIGLILITLGGISTYIVTYYIAPYAIIMRHNTTFDVSWNEYNFKAKKIDLVVQDSISLDSYLIEPKEDSLRGLIIMVHGIGSCKEPFAGIAEELAEIGVGSFLFDLRAHGKSDGEYCTYGFNEKSDISIIVDSLKKRHPTIPIGIWGASLGGAIAIQSIEMDDRIEFGLIECTFTELDRIVFDYQKRYTLGIGFKFITDKSLEISGEIANFNPDEVKPINSVKNITCPMLIAHGTNDQNISFEYGELLYENLNSKQKSFIKVNGAGHNSMYQYGGIEYKNKLFNFIQKQLN